MLDLLTVLASAEGEESPKTAFYVLGGLLAVWAVALGALGLKRPSLPEGERGARAIMAMTALLVAGACASAILTS